jgi:uncharacterized protein
VEVVRHLVERGVELDACSNKGGTALWRCCFAGHTEVLKLLLEARADYQRPNVFGRSPLDVARQYGHEELLAILKVRW